MTVLALILGLTDLVLLAVILEYGHRLSDLENIENHKKWQNQYDWNKYVSKKLDTIFRNLGIWPYDGSYKHDDALNHVEELNPTHPPVNVDLKMELQELKSTGVISENGEK